MYQKFPFVNVAPTASPVIVNLRGVMGIIVDLSGLSGNFTFDYSDEVVGRFYFFSFRQGATPRTITYAAGKFESDFGFPAMSAAPNGQVTYLGYCREAGKIQIVSPGAVASILAASETIQGIIQIATEAEALARTNDTKAITPLKMAKFVNTYSFISAL